MSMKRCVWIVAMASALLAGRALALDVEMKTQSWPCNDKAFADFNKRIARMRGHNLAARPEAKVVDTPLSFGQARMLTDGSAGVRLGNGRVGIDGQPAVITFYLGMPKAITEIGLFTFNSDARTNQDFEVRLANNSEHPGVKPVFPKEPHLTTGLKILGPDAGGFYTSFRAKTGGELVPGKADWVEFRVWRTYNEKAGSPAKALSQAIGWTSVVEIEILGDEKDVIEIAEDDIDRRQAELRATTARLYQKKAMWQDTMLAVREALMAAESARAGSSDFKPCVSLLMRGGVEPVKLTAKVAGLKRLWLEADTSPDGYDADQAIWGDPELVDKAGKRTPLISLKPAYVQVGWGELCVDQDFWEKPLRVGKREFKRGLWAHAPSQLCYELDGKYESFEVWVGVGGGGGSAFLKVLDKPTVEGHLDDLWARVGRDFADPASRQEEAWEKEDGIWTYDWPVGDVKPLAQRYAKASGRTETLARQADALAKTVTDAAGLARVRELYHRSRRLDEALTRAREMPTQPLRLAIEDLSKTFAEKYPNGPVYLQRLTALEGQLADAMTKVQTGAPEDIERIVRLTGQLSALREEALLANPLLDFDRLLVIKRKPNLMGLPANWQGNCSLPRAGYDNEIDCLSPPRTDGKLATLYRPDRDVFVGDVDLHFDADRMLFSSIGANGQWHIYEIKADGSGLRQVTRDDPPDVDNYDACYLPNEDILFCSTASFTGVPCVYGSSHVAMLYRMKDDGSHVRQLCFEQDHDWCPTVLPNGRVLYARWEYTDTPHSQTRFLFHMNPDGTGQAEYTGSNSYWPNSFFYAKPMPGSPTKVVSVISGHHGDARMGELVIFDPSRGRREASGAVQRIPGYGKKVEPVIKDALVNASWPKFLHPWPLSEKYILVACKPTPKSNWGIYLVDVFDNILLLREEPGYALLEPVPFRKTPRPPVIADRVPEGRTDAILYVSDIYTGPGLKGIPRGTVKQLRIFTYNFAYQGMGGLLGVVGMDGPWDIKRVLGTVPVQEDGSVKFRVPANTPISIQPLDAEGEALQLMRSWMTAMPGEVLSCVGCHESQNTTVSPRSTLASSRPPSEITPWRGPVRGFSYPREVQPVIDKYCLACHSGQPRPDGKEIPDLRGDVQITDFRMVTPGNGGGNGGKFSVGYAELHRYVRRPGIESDYHLLTPMEFHADTTELVQMLRKGHHNVELDPESWDRLITWIDLNAPYHGTWHEQIKDPGVQRERRRELRKLYAGIDEDPEAIPDIKRELGQPIMPKLVSIAKPEPVSCSGWPFDAADAKRRQDAAGPVTQRTLDLGGGMKMDLVLMPAGEFVMGSLDETPDERPLAKVKIDKPFWVGRCEVSNEQYARFDPSHDSHVESKNAYQFGIHGYPLDGPKQPVVRLSWSKAMDFCRWLSRQTGETFVLPTEAQWEYACRAGTATPFFYGGFDADFSKFANVADAKLSEFASNPYTVFEPLKNASKYDDWIPKDTRFNDGGLVTADIGSYAPNAWGLTDMHGNVWEWTYSSYRPYRSYSGRADDGREDGVPDGLKVVRGGSWRDRPYRCTSSFRLGYRWYQQVHDVGFRVICEPTAKKLVQASAK